MFYFEKYLCSFGSHNRHVHNQEVKDATAHLLSNVIPVFCRILDNNTDINISGLITHIHQR